MITFLLFLIATVTQVQCLIFNYSEINTSIPYCLFIQANGTNTVYHTSACTTIFPGLITEDWSNYPVEKVPLFNIENWNLSEIFNKGTINIWRKKMNGQFDLSLPYIHTGSIFVINKNNAYNFKIDDKKWQDWLDIYFPLYIDHLLVKPAVPIKYSYFDKTTYSYPPNPQNLPLQGNVLIPYLLTQNTGTQIFSTMISEANWPQTLGWQAKYVSFECKKSRITKKYDCKISSNQIYAPNYLCTYNEVQQIGFYVITQDFQKEELLFVPYDRNLNQPLFNLTKTLPRLIEMSLNEWKDFIEYEWLTYRVNKVENV